MQNTKLIETLKIGKNQKVKLKWTKEYILLIPKQLRNFLLNTFNISPGNYDHNLLYEGVKCPTQTSGVTE